MRIVCFLAAGNFPRLTCNRARTWVNVRKGKEFRPPYATKEINML